MTLLATDWGTPETLLAIACVYALGLFITAWVFALVFNAARNTKYLKLQTNLMIKMAEKAGVTSDEIEGIVNDSFPVRFERERHVLSRN